MTSLQKKKQKWKRELKIWLERNGLGEYCENCGSTNPPIDISHRMKQRFILTKAEYMTIAILCRRCHTTAEHSGHENLKKFHDDLIARRRVFV
jgi:hypothetical protein